MSRDPFAALRHAPFRRYLIGRSVMSLGLLMVQVAIGWEIYERTGSPTALGLTGLVLMIPVLLFSLPAGQIIDRVNRRSVVIASVSLQTLVTVGLTLLSWLHADVAWIYAALFVSGIARTFQYPAHSAMVPQIVGPDLFPNAVTWSANSFFVAASIGPALGGFMIAWTGGATAVYAFGIVTCLGFLATAIALPKPPTPTGSASGGGWKSLAAGIHFVRQTPMILAPITLDMFAVILGGATTLMPIFAKDILAVGPVGLGWLRAAPALGGVISAIAIASLPPFRHAGRALVWGVAIFGVATIAFGLSRNFAFSLVVLFILGAADMVSVVVRQTLIQTLTPDSMRGRVSAVNSVFIGASNELGGFESGVTAAWFGPVLSVAGGGVGTLIVIGLAVWNWPQLRAFGAMSSATTATGVSAAEEEKAGAAAEA